MPLTACLMAVSIESVVRKVAGATEAHPIVGAIGARKKFNAGAFEGLSHTCEVVGDRIPCAAFEIRDCLPANRRSFG